MEQNNQIKRKWTAQKLFIDSETTQENMQRRHAVTHQTSSDRRPLSGTGRPEQGNEDINVGVCFQGNTTTQVLHPMLHHNTTILHSNTPLSYIPTPLYLKLPTPLYLIPQHHWMVHLNTPLSYTPTPLYGTPQ